MLRVVICDDLEEDRAVARRGVEEYLADHQSLRGRVDVFSEPSALLDALEGGAVWDVALLDVYMPGMLGTEVATELSARLEHLTFLFLTTSRDHAVEAFALGAAHYLVKPFSQAELNAALDRAVKLYLKREGKSILLQLGNGATRAVLLGEIAYIESVGRRRVIHTVQGSFDEHQQSLTKLSEDLEALSPGQFISPYRGYLVNQDAIRTITPQGILLQSGTRIPLKEGSFRKTRDVYFRWAFRKEEEE